MDQQLGQQNSMKKYILIIVPIIIVVVISLIFISKQNNNYIIKISEVDDRSPDRVLSVYKDNQKIDFDSIYYLNDVFICDSTVPNVSKSAVKRMDKLKVKLKDGKIVKAKVLKEEK